MTTSMRRAGLAACAAIALLGLSCAAITRGDFNLISLQQEWQLGQQLERDIAQQLRLVNDASITGYVDQLGRRLVAQTQLRELPWKFHVVADPRINAFNVPGGHVYVHTGLIAAADDVAQLAGVMGHEIAHGAERHATEQLSRAYGLNILAGVVLGQNPPVYQQILAQIVGSGGMAKFSREAERQADELGVQYMYRAGYDPRGLVRIFQKLLAQRRSQPGSVARFFATHPLTESRIRTIEQQIAGLPAKPGLISRDSAYQNVRREVGRYH
ncbi:MAG TPA: M48 family metallopeptidase [Thermoanaerobaculia bacterium]|nr:M48 family metallopeptidase [Thermoanaerobaculia bacterium]